MWVSNMEKKCFEDIYGPEKVIRNMKMASFLVLNGCKLNHTKKDLVDQSRYIYFFAQNKRLEAVISKYPEYKDSFIHVGEDMYKKYLCKLEFDDESIKSMKSEGEQK